MALPIRLQKLIQTKHTHDLDINDVPAMSEEEEGLLKQKKEKLDALLQSEQKAKYKIELLFHRARSLQKPTPGLMYFWENGSQLHGGGDAKIYLCPGKRLEQNECEGFIPYDSNGYGFLVCPHCQKVWRAESVIGEVGGVLTMQGWATLLLKYYRKLDQNADIYVKMTVDDLRAVTRMEQEKELRGEKLHRVRAARPKYIYPQKNIVRDVSNGADLYKRFYAFLQA